MNIQITKVLVKVTEKGEWKYYSEIVSKVPHTRINFLLRRSGSSLMMMLTFMYPCVHFFFMLFSYMM